MESMPAAAPTLDALLAHGGLVRAAARAVLQGDAEVEDVVQETWLRALDQGPRAPGALRAWLRRVARNLAIDSLRKSDRRQRHEAAAARPEALPSVEAIAEREEARRLLVGALLSLDEPYRTALLLRWYEDLPVAEVAERLHVPVETARTRLRRGLERLRERLKSRCDSTSRVFLPALNSWAGPVVGGLAVKKAVVAAAVLLFALAGGYVALHPGREDGRSSGRVPEATAAMGEATGARAESTPTLAAVPMGEERGAATDAGLLPYASGVVVDREGRPIPDVAVLCRGRQDIGMGQEQDQGFEFHRNLASPAARTDPEGRFRVEDGVKRQVSLVFIKDGYAPGEYRDLGPDTAKNQEVRVTLAPGRRFTLSVKDTDGRGIEGARVILWLKADAKGHTLFGGHTTDAKGRLDVGWLADGAASLGQVHVGGTPYEARSLRSPDIRDEEEVVLARTMPMVVVKDAETGRPLADACGLLYGEAGDEPVAALTPDLLDPLDRDWAVAVAGVLVPYPWPPSPSGVERERGSFRAPVAASGHVPAEASLQIAPDKEPPRVEVGLKAGVAPMTLSGKTEPTSGVSLDLRASMPKGWGANDETHQPLLAHVQIGPDGRFIVRGLPEGEYRLTARASGFAPGFWKITAPEEGVLLRLERAARLDVLLRGPDGAPRPSAWVCVGVEGRDLAWNERTGPDGVARFEGLPAGKAHAIPTRGGAPFRFGSSADFATVALASGQQARIEIREPSRVPTTFRVRDEDGRPCASLDLTLKVREGWSIFAEGEFQRVQALALTTDANGEARADLYLGAYEATLSRGATRRSSVVRPDPAGAPTDLLWVTSGATLFGRVTEQGTGAPVADRPVFAWLDDPGAREKVGQAMTDADGRYEMTGLPDRPLSVSFALRSVGPEGRSDASSPFPSARLELTLGAKERRQRDVVTPRLTGPGAEEPAVDVAVLTVEEGTRAPLADARIFVEVLRGGIWFSAGDGKTGPDGRAVVRVLAGERVRVHAYRSAAGGVRTHEPRVLELPRAGDRLDAEVALSRSAAPTR